MIRCSAQVTLEEQLKEEKKSINLEISEGHILLIIMSTIIIISCYFPRRPNAQKGGGLKAESSNTSY